MIYVHKRNHLLLDAEDLYGGYSKFHMTENNRISHEDMLAAEHMTKNNRIGNANDDQSAVEPGRTPLHKTINAYALKLEKFDQLNTEEAPCEESDRD